MNEPRKAGRPRKHLADEHHFQTAEERSFVELPENPIVENAEETPQPASIVSEESVAPPVADTILTEEVVVENPTHALSVEQEIMLQNNLAAASDIPYAEDVDQSSHSSEESIISKSPAEEKIQALMQSHRGAIDLDGWHSMDTEIVLQQPPRNGMPIRLSEHPQGEGQLGFWKRTRAFNGKRFAETGKWVCFQSGMNLTFDPKFWKERF